MSLSLFVDLPPHLLLEEGPAPAEHRILMNRVTWARYEELVEHWAERRVRISYLEGQLEIMSPGFPHEESSSLIGRMVEALAEELDIPLKAIGATTLKRPALRRAAEADRSYYVQSLRHLASLSGIAPNAVPPPDLVIEVEVSSPLLDKLAIYAGLGVPEIWRHNARGLVVLLLDPDGIYAESPTSRAFPFLPMEAFARQLDNRDPLNDTRWARAFRLWVREVVAPLYLP